MDAQAKCPVCQSQEATHLFDLGTDRVVKCCSCELTYAITPPFEKNDLYNENYFTGEGKATGYANYQAELESHSSTFGKRLQDAEKRLGAKGSVLDYGCAYGHLAKVAKDAGWQVVGTDLSYDAVKQAHEDYDVTTFVSDLTQAPVREGCFNLVTLYDVIEHMDQPLAALKQIAPMLAPGGLLHITTPNVDSISAKLMRTSWYHYKPQEHLLYFSPKTIRDALSRAGFETVHVETAPSRMTLGDILVRLRRYSRPLADLALKVAQATGLDKKVVKIHIGEMQVWARPRASAKRQTPVFASRQVSGSTGHGHATGAKPSPGAGSANSGSSRAAVTTQTQGSAAVAAKESACPVVQLRVVPANKAGRFDFLCCPSCRGDLVLNEYETRLDCGSCHIAYQVKGGVPIMTPYQEAAPRTASAGSRVAG